MSLIDIEKVKVERKKFPKIFLGVAVGLTITSLGLAVGALITLNNSSGGAAELGGGLVQTPACDTTGVTVTPFESFVNRTDHKFTFNEITLTNISENCAGKDFIIIVRDGSGNVLPISGVALPEDANGDINWNGDNPKTYWQLRSDTNEVSITFNPSRGLVADSIAGFADARNVYKITLESTDHSNS